MSLTLQGRTALAASGGSSGLATSTIKQFLYLKPAAVPDAQDDDFADSSLAVAWNTWNPGTLTTVTETTERLKIVQTSHAGQGWGGVVRTIPAHTRYVVTAAMQQTAGSTSTTAEYGSLFIIFPEFRSARQKSWIGFFRVEESATAQDVCFYVQKRHTASVGVLTDAITTVQFSNALANASDGTARRAIV